MKDNAMNRGVRVIIALLLIAFIPTTYALPFQPPKPRHVITVADGNVEGLIEAINEANSEEFSDFSVSIYVSGDFRFNASHSIPPILGEVYVLGPARFIGGGADTSTTNGDQKGPGRLILVQAGGILSLRLLELSDFSLNHDNEALIENLGQLFLDQVQIKDTFSEGYCAAVCTPQMPILFNGSGAALELRQVSIVDSGATNVHDVGITSLLNNDGGASIVNSQVVLGGHRPGWERNYLISNGDSLYLADSTFYFRKRSDRDVPELVFTESQVGARTFVDKSIISGFGSTICKHAISVGNTLIDVQGVTCDWNAPGDMVGVDPKLVWRKVDANWKPGPQILTHALVPLSDSPVIDSVPFEWCQVDDLLGNDRVTAPLPKEGPDTRTCDRGAVEYWSPGLGDGGINGYFYNPDDDGHYIYILQTDYLTLVTWNTFDEDGNWAWIYGTGELVDGRMVVAESYVNRKGVITPDTVNLASGAEFWGTLQVELFDCLNGIVRYESAYPGFGSGTFPIKRLAFVKQLGCVD